MKVLVTGGTGVVGVAAINALLRHGHEVRLLSRHAHEAIEQWADGVEAFVGDVSDAGTIRGAARGCSAVLHAAGLVQDESKDRTLESVNVQGTRHMLGEAQRAGVRRFVYVSALGVERGQSDYHRSRLAAEKLVEDFAGSGTIVRLATVYGPGDSAIGRLLRLLRALPALPVFDAGDQAFQPIWHDDAGEALAVLAISDAGGPLVALAGPDVTTINDVLDRFCEITGTSPARIPFPVFLAQLGLQAAEALGLSTPVTAAQLTMLLEPNVLQPGDVNALELLALKGTPLSVGLARLAETQAALTSHY